MGAHGAAWTRMHAGALKSTQRMDTNASYAWARTPAKGHAVAGAGY